MKIAVLSDIHANLSAFNAVLDDIHLMYDVDSFAFLGDMINYGMRPNEIVDKLNSIDKPIIANLWGNHEKALFDESQLNRFSSNRGVESLKYTKRLLTEDSFLYIHDKMCNNGFVELNIDGKNILFIHGDISDFFWGKMNEMEQKDEKYFKYDYVFHGHTHIPQYNEIFYYVDNHDMRNKKRTVFVNPGSVGQPRNHNPRAQYLVFDTLSEECHFASAEYDISSECILYTDCVDSFYKERLKKGI